MALYSRKYTISIDKPCSESWDEMLPAGNSRFCGACAKHVVDFTKMSDRELTDFLRNRKHAACGRFRAEQLEKVYAERPQLKLPFPKRFARFMLSLFIGSAAEKASAQTDTLPVTPIDTIAKYVAIDSLEDDTAVVDADPIPEQEQLRLIWDWPETAGPGISLIEVSELGIISGTFLPEPVEVIPFPPFRQWFPRAKKPAAEFAQGDEQKPAPAPGKENIPETAVLPPLPTLTQKKKKA